ncbi:hypothetical protein [Fredinandcohnia onubensis]|uniref:hypothetical protein n=1 Tax=Fredinandcohnia onubensis TaxID=1571209 RepID=UPI001156B881|nr:hypothetical protein [Fredinandcohnia onubensis]
MQRMEKCYLGVNDSGNPIIHWEFEGKDNFDNFSNNRLGFSNVSDKEENIQEYLLIKDYSRKQDYSITISKQDENVLMKVVFDLFNNICLTGIAREDEAYHQFVEAYQDEGKGNIQLEMSWSGGESKKRFFTFGFFNNEFSTLFK